MWRIIYESIGIKLTNSLNFQCKILRKKQTIVICYNQGNSLSCVITELWNFLIILYMSTVSEIRCLCNNFKILLQYSSDVVNDHGIDFFTVFVKHDTYLIHKMWYLSIWVREKTFSLEFKLSLSINCQSKHHWFIDPWFWTLLFWILQDAMHNLSLRKKCALFWLWSDPTERVFPKIDSTRSSKSFL